MTPCCLWFIRIVANIAMFWSCKYWSITQHTGFPCVLIVLVFVFLKSWGWFFFLFFNFPSWSWQSPDSVTFGTDGFLKTIVGWKIAWIWYIAGSTVHRIFHSMSTMAWFFWIIFPFLPRHKGYRALVVRKHFEQVILWMTLWITANNHRIHSHSMSISHGQWYISPRVILWVWLFFLLWRLFPFSCVSVRVSDMMTDCWEFAGENHFKQKKTNGATNFVNTYLLSFLEK